MNHIFNFKKSASVLSLKCIHFFTCFMNAALIIDLLLMNKRLFSSICLSYSVPFNLHTLLNNMYLISFINKNIALIIFFSPRKFIPA